MLLAYNNPEAGLRLTGLLKVCLATNDRVPHDPRLRAALILTDRERTKR